jgi:membrane carboxypeptidase/penicillin-binding protein
MAAQPTRALALVSPVLPDQLTPLIKELHEVSNLAEFLCTSVMRVQDTQKGEFSLSFGESSALISLMQSVTERLVDATTNLEDLRFCLGKEAASHE